MILNKRQILSFILFFCISSLMYGMKGAPICTDDEVVSFFGNAQDIENRYNSYAQRHFNESDNSWDSSTNWIIAQEYNSMNDAARVKISEDPLILSKNIELLCTLDYGKKQSVKEFVERWKDVCPSHSYQVKEYFTQDSLREEMKDFFKEVEEILIRGSLQKNAAIGFKAIKELETCGFKAIEELETCERIEVPLDLNQIMKESVPSYRYPCEEVICKKLFDIKIKIEQRSDYELLLAKMKTLKMMPFFLYILKTPLAWSVKKLLKGFCFSEKNAKIVSKHVETFIEIVASGILIVAYAGICHGLWTSAVLLNPFYLAIFAKNIVSMIFTAFRLINTSELRSMDLKDTLIQIMLSISIILCPSFAPQELKDVIENFDVVAPMCLSFTAQVHHNWVTKNIHFMCEKFKNVVSWIFCCGKNGSLLEQD